MVIARVYDGVVTQWDVSYVYMHTHTHTHTHCNCSSNVFASGHSSNAPTNWSKFLGLFSTWASTADMSLLNLTALASPALLTSSIVLLSISRAFQPSLTAPQNLSKECGCSYINPACLFRPVCGEAPCTHPRGQTRVSKTAASCNTISLLHRLQWLLQDVFL